MTEKRRDLPQLAGGLFLTDAGLETDLIFNHGIDIPEFAAHTLLAHSAGRYALAQYFRGFLSLARRRKTGFILDSQTWKAHSHWAEDLGCNEQELRDINLQAIDFIACLRDEYSCNAGPVVLNAVIGPRGDAYAPESVVGAKESEDYHAQQIGWLADTEVEMVSALTFTQSSEAIGIVNAARRVGLPIVVSFTVETDGALPGGQALDDAIAEVDRATDRAAAYYMVNCAHPDHFSDVLADMELSQRIRGLRCNASRCSHEELDAADELDAGDPREFGVLYRSLVDKMPWINVLGGCCGADLRHVTEVAIAVENGGRSSS